MLHLEKNGSNFRQVINVQNIGTQFKTFDGKIFELTDYKKAHYTWEAVRKDGEKTAVKLKSENGKTFEYETDALRAEFCPEYVKGTKEYKEKKVLTFSEVFETFKQLAQSATLDEIVDALIFIQDLEFDKRKAKEEAEKKEFEEIERRYKEMLAKRNPQPTTKKGKGKK